MRRPSVEAVHHADPVFVSRIILIAVAWLAIAVPCRAESPSADPDSGLIRVTLEDGATFTAREARPAGNDMVLFVLPDASPRYVPAVRIGSIRDAQGRDWTRSILDHKKTFRPVEGEPVEETYPEPGRKRGPRGLTWRGHPYPETKSFLITELGVMYRLDRYPYSRSTTRLLLTFDLGWMKNIGTRHAVGFSGYSMPADQTNRLGIRARYRRWLSRTTSVDVSPGVILSGENPTIEYDPPGLVLGATLNAGDLVAVMVDAELARNWEFAEQSPPFTTRVEHTDVTWRAGAKLGSGLGLAGSLAIVGLVAYVVFSGGAD